MKVRLTQIDGKLPNLALMRLSSYHKSKGDEVFFSHSVDRTLFDGEYDRVYGSAIFSQSFPLLERFKRNFPDGIIGGTGTSNLGTVEEITGAWEQLDYTPYPSFNASVGFTQRGCRLRCGFCVVPAREGKPKTVSTITDIYRGKPWPKKIVILDNDFFGQQETEWRQRIAEMRDGKFLVCFTQGVNIRNLTSEQAQALASVEYRDGKFERRRLYTAWDNLKDENIFFEGVERLEIAGIPPKHLMVYMLIGYDPSETFERIIYRFSKMVEIGVMPYPMVYGKGTAQIKAFQRWVIRGLYRHVPFDEYKRNPDASSQDLESAEKPGIFANRSLDASKEKSC